MAKPRIAVLVEVTDNPHEPIQVWVNKIKDRLDDIASVEGITKVYPEGETRAFICVDARYNVDEIAEELRELLTSEST